MLQFFILIVSLFGTGIFIWYILDLVFSEVPHLSSRTHVIETILPELQITADSVVYDLGCGQGRVVRIIAQRHPSARVIGIEHGLLTFLFAKIRTRQKNVSIHYDDIFTADITDATHIYLYLFPNVMKRLEPVLQKKLRQGTHIVAIDFPFPNIVPKKILPLPTNPLWPLGKNAYIYEI